MRARILIAAACLLPALAACGSQAAPSRPAARPEPSPSSSGPQGYQVAVNLQRSLKQQMDAKARRLHVGYRVRSVLCIEQGRQKATCLAKFTDGSSEDLDVVIAADGMSYVTR
jgi:2-polyprenyl-6-methoxyphenol hydroxylase-like FAD-dependent oxidoreductase